MISYLHYIIFIIFIAYAFLKSISYAIYEIKQEENKFGGIVIITFSIFCVLTGMYTLFNL